LLRAALRSRKPECQIVGIESDSLGSKESLIDIDQIFAPDRIDCIMVEAMELLRDPASVLGWCQRLLTPNGMLIASASNGQHHSNLPALLTSDVPLAQPAQRMGEHLFTYSTAVKLLLDAGFAPSTAGAIEVPMAEQTFEALLPILKQERLHPGRTRRDLETRRYIFRGTPLPEARRSIETPPLSFVVCVSDETLLRDNLLASPCLRDGTIHEIILIRNPASAAHGLNEGLARARHAIVIGVHQDVYLPRGWVERFWRQYQQAEARWGRLGVAGVYGILKDSGRFARAGRVVDRRHFLGEPPPLPALAHTLDEIVLAVRKDAPLRFDPTLGFHFYGSDICLSAQKEGWASAVLRAECFHHSRGVGLPPGFGDSAKVFAAKWRAELPIATSCVFIDRDGQMKEW
jgi:hypothetical protein